MTVSLVYSMMEPTSHPPTQSLAGIPIGFSFEYGGQQFTHFLVGSNGFLVLRNDGDAAYQLSYDLSYLYNSAVNLLGCFTKSVTATDDTKISYSFEGEKGNHVLTVEFNKPWCHRWLLWQFGFCYVYCAVQAF